MTIIPIKELKDTNKISRMAKETGQPIFVTKNGYGDLVVMSQEVYARNFAMQKICEMIDEAEENLRNGGKLLDGIEVFAELEKKYGF
jgi:glycerol-3-phosphate dehydrogenase